MTQGHVRALLPPPKADPSGTTAQGVRTRLLPRGGPRVGLQVHSAGAARDRARRTCSPWTLGPPPAASLAPRCAPASSPLLVPRGPRAGVSWVGEAARQGVPGRAGGRAATPMAGEEGAGGRRSPREGQVSPPPDQGQPTPAAAPALPETTVHPRRWASGHSPVQQPRQRQLPPAIPAPATANKSFCTPTCGWTPGPCAGRAGRLGPHPSRDPACHRPGSPLASPQGLGV